MNTAANFESLYHDYVPTPDNRYPFQYFDSLDDSIIYCKRRVSKHHEVKKAVETVWNSFSEEFRSNYKTSVMEQKKHALENILCNLLRGFSRGDAVSVSFRKVTWSAGRKYLITFSYQVPEVVLEMERTGWIHFVHGFHHGSRDKRNRTARIWMSEKLAHLFFKIVPAEDICQEFKQPVILRNSDKKDIPYLDTPFSNRRRKDIQKYNAFMKPFKVEYTPCERATVKNLYFEEFNVFREYTPNWMYHFFKYRVKRRSDTEGYVLKEEDRKTIPNTKNRQDNRENTGLLEQIVVKVLLNTDLTCVFNRGETMEGKAFRLGGRFYTGDRGHQGISRAERATITINGEPTVELDFKAYHISMLYAMNGWQIEGDPYIIEGKENLRTLVKKLLLVGLNADSERATLGRIGEDIFSLLARQEITEEELDLLSNIITSRPDWKKLIQDLKRKHETIAGHFFNDAGIHLMNRDSRIMRDILMDLIGKGVPCLPVHDSVIVPERYKDELRMVMDKCYRKHMNGLTCPIEQK